MSVDWALAMSVTAIVISCLALILQWRTWRLSGPRITVSCETGVDYAEGREFDYIAIVATNSGRLGTEIQTCGFMRPDKSELYPGNYLTQEELDPEVLDAGGRVTFYLDPWDFEHAIKSGNLAARDLRPFVVSGHGRRYGKPLSSLRSHT